MIIRVGIVGGAGYTAGELLRIFLNHPHVNIEFVHSSSNAGNKIYSVHEGLFGETDMVFTDQLSFASIDVLFICSGHGESKKFIAEHENEFGKHLKIIDLSQDYRDESNGFVYGLPEVNKDRIAMTNRLANPGCFATAIQLGLLPLAKNGLLSGDVHTNAITGSTGAGVKPSATSHFSWRNNNISIYKPFTHQHLTEINMTLHSLQPNFDGIVNFIPMRGDFPRGIFVSSYTKCSLSAEEAVALYKEFYKDAAFTFVMEANPDLKQVVNTNKAIVHVEKHDDKLLVISMIDNLLKGASGQAVQNMNLMFGLDEGCGLHFKSLGF